MTVIRDEEDKDRSTDIQSEKLSEETPIIENNTDSLENQSPIETEITVGESNPVENTNSINTNQEAKNMEVHHHPDIHHRSKKWKEYIIEFFMIFLAVTMGFFAEKIREDNIDKKREKEFINSLKEDLKNDTTSLSEIIKNTQRDIIRLDSFVFFLNLDQRDTTQINNLYFYARNATRRDHFQQTDRTIIQLNYSGNFRLIKDASTVFNLLVYEKDVDTYKINASNDGFERNNLDPFISKIFDNNIFVTMLDSENKIQKPFGVNKLKSYDKDFINQIIYYINQLKGSYLYEKKLELNLKNKAEIILEVIQKNYSIL